MKFKFSSLILAGALLGSVFTAHGADNVITDPTLHNGSSPEAIDPLNKVRLWPSNQRPTKAQLYAKPGFGVIQDFTGFVRDDTLDGGFNIIKFTDPNRADLRVRFGGTAFTVDAGRSNLGDTWGTSSNGPDTEGNAFLFGADNRYADGAHTISTFLDFGTYADDTFSMENAPSVSAVAFTITSHRDRYASINSIDVIYYSSTGAELVTQTLGSSDFLPTPPTNQYSLLFAYAAAEGVSIGSVQINVNVKAAEDRNLQVLLGIDDVGYTTAIPEASHVTMVFVAASLLVALGLRRRARAGK